TKYPLAEKIGNPDLLVGRESEFKVIIYWWDRFIPLKLSILSVKKLLRTYLSSTIFMDSIMLISPFYMNLSHY
uniref:hypothetical protein n=1 Tax=Candidatus Marithrix sp. Canyon 246 TaxID=1827136 RepID=UPI001C0D24A7